MEITFKPGQTNTINVIEGGTAEFTAKDDVLAPYKLDSFFKRV